MQTIILTDGYGQLCNRMWMYASWIALAEQYGFEFENRHFDDHAQYFSITQQMQKPCHYPITFNRPARKLDRLFKHYQTHDLFTGREVSPPELLKTGRNLAIRPFEGHQDADLIHTKGEIIRTFFSPSPEWYVKQLLRRPGKTYVGLHLRRGDFRDWMGGKFYHEDSHCLKIIGKVIAERGLSPSDVVVFIASNETIDLSNYQSYDVELAAGNQIEDLYNLARCDLLIGTRASTFTMWASFYGKIPLYTLEETEESLKYNGKVSPVA